MSTRYQNTGRRQYTDAEKAAYYKKLAMSGRSQVRGSGAYNVRSAPRPIIGRPYIRGQGAYKVGGGSGGIRRSFNARKIGSAIGSTGGALIGSMIAPGIGTVGGAKIGSAIGDGLGGLFKSITGWGNYNIKENTLLGKNPASGVPSFGDGCIRVKRDEFICDIDATTAFTNNSFPINPGLDTTFPWVSAIANNYEQYRINGMIFYFKSTSSDAIASTTNLGLGQVIMASDYNSADAAYVNSPQMMGSMFSNSGKPSQDIMHAIECAPTETAQKLYYVRSGDVPSGTDIRLYDMCNFQIATEKMPDNYPGMGQLWVSYDITFCKPVMNNQLGYSLNTDVWDTVAPSTTNFFGTARTLAEHSNLGTSIVGNELFFPVTMESGYYQVTYVAQGASTSVANPTFTFTNCAQVQTWINNTMSSIANGSTASPTYFYTAIIKITDKNAKIGLSGGTLPTTPTFGNVVVTQVNGEIFV